jgi:AraC-like DNA-binding protein
MTEGANRLAARATSPDAGARPTPAVQVRAFVDAFERLGYEVDALLDSIGLRRADLDDADRLIPCAAMGALFGRAQQMRPLKNLWTRLAAETPLGAFPLLDYLVVTSDSVGAGLRQLARYFRLVGVPCEIDIRDDETPIRIVYVSHGGVDPFSVEYGVTLDVLHLRAETDNRVSFAYVSYTHQPDDVREVEQLLGCPVRSGASRAGLAVSRDAWVLPLRRRDPVLRRVLEGHADAVARGLPSEDGLALEVRRLLTAHLARGNTAMAVVARELGTSSRTLQRRLSAVGLSFQQLLDAVRRDTAERCLTDSALSIAEVAYLIGYSEPAAFHRAFKRWSGMTPEGFRERRIPESAR